ncbi:uncharacterized protein LOC118434843 [Folsomia candida]|uniref:uncharacterized protein LOC118434843 n=1 Tax=Folsomia candida TaxID=158441 RepID=UPI0016051866|nr:uncharacterized protein LOC118434843 [Folsomia candida]
MSYKQDNNLVLLHIFDLPELVILQILDNLLNISDLKTLRLVSYASKHLVETYIPFYTKFWLKITDSNFTQIIDTASILNYRFWSNLQLNLNPNDFETTPTFYNFVHIYAKHVKALQVVNYPFKTLKLEFLSHFTNLNAIYFTGIWAINNFINFNPPEILKTCLIHLHLQVSSDGLKPNDFKKFGDFLNHFISLKSVRINCRANQQLLFRQVVLFYAKRQQSSSCICDLDSNFLSDFATFPNSTNYPELKTFCEICYEIKLDLSHLPLSTLNKPASLTDSFFSSIKSLRTILVGHNVTFPLYKLTNLTAITIQISKFNHPESFWYGNNSKQYFSRVETLPKLSNLHLTLHQDFQFVELEKCKQIFGYDGNLVKELVLELPPPEKVTIPDKEAFLLTFISKFKRLKYLKINNNWSKFPIHLLSVSLDKIEII